MKIGLYDPYLDTLGGGENYMLTMALCLSKNHEVTIFWDNEEEIRNGAKTRFNLNLSGISFKKNIFSTKISTYERLVHSKKYNSLVVLSDGSIPIVLSNLYVHFQSPMVGIKPSLLDRYKISRIKKVFVNSLFTKEHIDSTFHINSVVLYPPIRLYSGNYKKKNIILNVGRYGIRNSNSSYKKQEELLDAFIEMVKKGLTGWELVLVVSIKDTEKDQLHILRNKIGKYPITILENPDNEILKKQYGEAKIYWHASGFGEDIKKYPGRAEHFGMSTVEAMSAGAVPIVINLGGQKEIVEDSISGLLWNTKEELIKKTQMVIKDTEVMKKLSENAIKRSKNFSIEKFDTEINTFIT